MDGVNLYVLIFVILSISIAYIIDDLAFLSKGFGGLCGMNALAANLSSSIFLLNRAVMALTLPAIGFLVDSGISIRIMLIAIILSSILMFLLKLILYCKITRLMSLIGRVASLIYGADKVDKSGLDFGFIEYRGRLQWQPTIVMILFVAGMTVPSIIAIYFFENRAFFIQLGFLFNMTGTLLTILFIERKIALDAEKLVSGGIERGVFVSSISSIILSRALGVFLYILIMSYVLFFFY